MCIFAVEVMSLGMGLDQSSTVGKHYSCEAGFLPSEAKLKLHHVYTENCVCVRHVESHVSLLYRVSVVEHEHCHIGRALSTERSLQEHWIGENCRSHLRKNNNNVTTGSDSFLLLSV